jgi:hypothetical protein
LIVLIHVVGLNVVNERILQVLSHYTVFQTIQQVWLDSRFAVDRLTDGAQSSARRISTVTCAYGTTSPHYCNGSGEKRSEN